VQGGQIVNIKGTFVTGGVQGDAIRNIYGTALGAGFMWTQLYCYDAFFYKQGQNLRADFSNIYDTGSLNLDISRVVKTGNDVAPVNLSVRFWRRVA
jgi:hypothetical protein